MNPNPSSRPNPNANLSANSKVKDFQALPILTPALTQAISLIQTIRLTRTLTRTEPNQNFALDSDLDLDSVALTLSLLLIPNRSDRAAEKEAVGIIEEKLMLQETDELPTLTLT